MLQSSSAAILFVCCLLATYLVCVRSDARASNMMFAAFLLLTAIDISGWFAQGFWLEAPYLNRFRLVSGFLQMPFFYGFVMMACFPARRFDRADAAHLAPFLVSFLLASAASNSTWPSVSGFLIIALHVQFFSYIVACALVLRTFRRLYYAAFSDAGSRTFQWLTQLVIASFFAHLVVITKSFAISAGGSPAIVSALQGSVGVVALLMMAWITLQALLRPEAFRGVDRRANTIDDAPVQSSSAEAPGQIHEIRRIIEERELFLNPDLKLDDLAFATALTPRELSVLINQQAGMHFFDFINRYRVERAMNMLVARRTDSVVDVMLASGFNSKSSFNTAFRKFAHMAPSAYRRSEIAKLEQSVAESRTSGFAKPNDGSPYQL